LIPPQKIWWLSKLIKVVNHNFHHVCHDEKCQIKRRAASPLSTTIQREHEEALVKTGEAAWPLLICYRPMTMINNQFLNLRVKYGDGFLVMVDCRIGNQYST